MKRPTISKGPASYYAAPNQTIREISNGERGCLISLSTCADGKLIIDIYRCDEGIEIHAREQISNATRYQWLQENCQWSEGCATVLASNSPSELDAAIDACMNTMQSEPGAMSDEPARRGRPPLPASERRLPVTVRLTPLAAAVWRAMHGARREELMAREKLLRDCVVQPEPGESK